MYRQFYNIVSYFHRITIGVACKRKFVNASILVLSILYRVSCPRQKLPALYAYVFPIGRETIRLKATARGKKLMIEEILFNNEFIVK